MSNEQPIRKEPTEWAPIILSYVDSFEKNGSPPYQYSLKDRAVGGACCPLVCGLCCIWSTLWRGACCVCQCYRGEPICSGNGCTTFCDLCVFTCVESLTKAFVLPTLVIPRILTPQDQRAFLDVVARLQKTFTNLPDGHYSTMHYKLAIDVVMPMMSLVGDGRVPVPADVMAILAKIKTKLGEN